MVAMLKDECVWLFFFFFQAEDGIRDVAVTGVQTCALPIFAAVMQKANIVSLPTSCTPPLCSCCGDSFGISPPAGIGASPVCCAVMKAVISSQPMKFAMKASGSTCTIARLRGTFLV